MDLIFMGTPDFATAALEALIEAGHDIKLVVTQPDKPKGRSGEPVASAVKYTALRCGLPVFQPERIRETENIERIRQTPCDAIVVAAFGQIIPKDILEYPRYGCINIHASLLPKYRGAAPIQWAILNGEEKTGISVMRMGEGLDDGDILYTKEIAIRPDHTGGKLFDELAGLGAKAIVEALDKIDSLEPVKQDESKATKVGKIRKEMGRLDFSRPSVEIERYVRGLDPWPSAFTFVSGKMMKIWKAKALPESEFPGFSDRKPGDIDSVGGRLVIRTGDGFIEVLELQLEGKRRMSAEDYLRGHERTGNNS